MRRSTWSSTLAVAVAVLASSVVRADEKWYDAIAIGGHVQGSYVGSLGKDIPQTNQLRGYDTNPGFNLNQAQIRIAKPVGDDGYGFGIKLLAGSDAKVLHSNGLGTPTDPVDLEEAYVNTKWKQLTFTGGKFVTACGVEVIESPLNMTIEPGYLFFFGMPFTHTGVKAAYTLSDKVTLIGGLANGWDQVTDINPGKTIIFQLATNPLKDITANLSGSYGPELFGTTNVPASGNYNISKRTHLDAVLGYSGIPKVTLNAEGLWGQDSNIGGVNDSGTAMWNGFGLWASYAQSNILNPGVRFEVLGDENNANRFGSGVNQTAKELTLVNKFITSKNTFMRLEYRHDWSNQAAFTRNDGSAVRNQNTISGDWVVTF
jgi:hypothetical protein